MKGRSTRAGALVLALALAATAATSACSGGIFDQGPSDTLRAYSRAIQEKRYDDAYRYLSDEAKRSISQEAFRRAIEESPGDAIEVANALARPTGDPVVTATVSVPSGEELHMTYEGGRWRIDAAAIDLYSQATPRQALVGFIRAFERKRFDVLLKYVPDSEREGLDDEWGATAPPPPPVASAAPSGSASAGAPMPPPPAPTPPPPAAPPGTEGALTADKLKEAWDGSKDPTMVRIVEALKAALPTATIEESGDSAQMSYGAGNTIALVREKGAWKIKDF